MEYGRILGRALGDKRLARKADPDLARVKSHSKELSMLRMLRKQKLSQPSSSIQKRQAFLRKSMTSGLCKEKRLPPQRAILGLEIETAAVILPSPAAFPQRAPLCTPAVEHGVKRDVQAELVGVPNKRSRKNHPGAPTAYAQP